MLTPATIPLSMMSYDDILAQARKGNHRLTAPKRAYNDVIDYTNYVLECSQCDAALCLHPDTGLYYGSLTTSSRCYKVERK